MNDSNAEELDRRLAMNVQSLRGAMSQDVLAAAMRARGVPWHQQTVGRIESGQQKVKLAEAVILADVLGVTLDRLTLSSPESDAMEMVISAGADLEASAGYVARFVHALLTARERAAKVLADTDAGQSPRVQALRAEAAVRLGRHTLDAAVAEGVRRYEEHEDPENRTGRGGQR